MFFVIHPYLELQAMPCLLFPFIYKGRAVFFTFVGIGV
jgi:hypothetical protein